MFFIHTLGVIKMKKIILLLILFPFVAFGQSKSGLVVFPYNPQEFPLFIETDDTSLVHYLQSNHPNDMFKEGYAECNKSLIKAQFLNVSIEEANKMVINPKELKGVKGKKVYVWEHFKDLKLVESKLDETFLNIKSYSIWLMADSSFYSICIKDSSYVKPVQK